jgi:hypothetical protein
MPLDIDPQIRISRWIRAPVGVALLIGDAYVAWFTYMLFTFFQRGDPEYSVVALLMSVGFAAVTVVLAYLAMRVIWIDSNDKLITPFLRNFGCVSMLVAGGLSLIYGIWSIFFGSFDVKAVAAGVFFVELGRRCFMVGSTRDEL